MVDYNKLLGGVKKTVAAETKAKPINSTSRIGAMNSLRNRLQKEAPSQKENKVDQPQSRGPLHVNTEKAEKKATATNSGGEIPPAPFSSNIDGVEGVVDFEEIERVAAQEFQHPGQPEKFEANAAEELREAFHMLASHIEDADIVGQAIRRIMGHMQKHDFLRDLIGPEDIQLMTRGLRKSAGVMIQKKTEGKKSQKKVQSELNLKEFEDELGDAFNF